MPANTVDGWIRPKELCRKAKALGAAAHERVRLGPMPWALR